MSATVAGLALALGGFQAVAAPDFGSSGKTLAQGVAAEDAGDLTTAEARYRAFTQRYRGVPGGYYYLGNLLHDTGRTNEAAAVYRDGKAACPG